MKKIALMVAVGFFATALVLTGVGRVAAEQGAQCAPGNTADDDGDTLVNEGCPIVGTQSEDHEQCAVWNTWDDDGDTVVNDGCGGGWPGAAGAMGQPEVADTCHNNTDDDNMDGVINDGCPVVGGTSEAPAGCANNLNDDWPDDTYVNDGCPAVVIAGRAEDQSEGSAGTTETTPTPWPLDTNQCDEPPAGPVKNNDDDGAGPWATTKYNDGCPGPTTGVGGVQALPDAPTDTGSGNTAFYAVVSAAGLAAVVAITGSGWYARRRWLR